MTKKICIVTATRAEYGLLSTIIKRLEEEDGFQICVAVTGAHLSPEFGLTYRQIEEDGIRIDKKIEILMSADTPTAVSKSMGLALMGFSEYFGDLDPDAVMILGDRYEMLAVACAAMNARIPIIHLYGGETTEGAVDEMIRHAITKMSYLHFTSTELYRKRVIQLGEDPERVFCVGALGVENALNTPHMSREELQSNLKFSIDSPYAIVTFHPVTLEGNAEQQLGELLCALESFSEMKFIFTKANADADGRIINKRIAEFAAVHDNAVLFDSLGIKLYLNAVRHCAMVIGNSSSGIVEVPSFHVPTINIGERQKGRMQAESVINCRPLCEEIRAAIRFARSEAFAETVKTVRNPYGDGKTSDKIVECLKRIMDNSNINLKKQFYDIAGKCF